ncbi:MAG: histidine phosphatase family protein [Clostridium sp.]|nr:histidine phosphatase family protein [Clostridium sp.]
MKLYIIRHGQTDWNVAGKIQGRRDIPLNAQGRLQAQALAAGMAKRPVTAVFSSPQRRALETAQAIAKPLNLTVRQLPQLVEISYGAWEGKTAREILAADHELYEAWWKHPATVAPPGGETLGQVDGRCIQAWEHIRTCMTGDTAVVSHGSTLAHFIVHLLKGQPEAREIIVGNASITTIEYVPEDGTCRLVELNDSRHLEGR